MKKGFYFSKSRRPSQVLALALSLVLVFGSTCTTWAQGGLPPSLKTVPTPEPVNLGDYLNSVGGVPTAQARAAAIALGKALFWDMQVGSDGQACASCHFHAGADNRSKNQINPGLLAGDTTFQVGGPNKGVFRADFPFTQPVNPDFPVDVANPLVRNINDVMSSMGVFNTLFVNVILGANAGPGFPDLGTFTADPVFHKAARITRRVEPRNTPTTINAVFNFSNFWDGRARNIFNGVNPFGELDPDARIFVNDAGPGLTPEIARIPDASLASQAVGPPLSDFEMSFGGRTFPELGRKMTQPLLQPLDGQPVAADDSVFGLPNALGVDMVDPVSGLLSGAANPITPGENLYVTLIKQAFQPRYWDNSVDTVNLPTSAGPQAFTQMEANFSLFWGLAVQLYEATLRSDDSKFDQFLEGTASLTSQEQSGMSSFFSGSGNCAKCHAGPEFTDHSVAVIRNGVPAAPPFFVPDNALRVDNARVTPLNPTNKAVVDVGMYNIAVRPTAEDLIRGGTAPAGFPLSFSKLAVLKAAGTLPAAVANFVPNLPGGAPTRTSVDGAGKVPGLRNVELTGPYMHNGSMSTLRQVVEFYTRGGNFPAENADNLDADLKDSIGRLQNAPRKQINLVAFLQTLTDNRVKIQSAPFDHPALFIPSGDGVKRTTGIITETMLLKPATGRNGDAANPLPTFLNIPPSRP